MNDPKERFSDRVENYVKYRPSYPKPCLDFLVQFLELTLQSEVADIGSGTGIFSRLILDQVARVYAVEPNTQMRLEAEQALGNAKNFVSIAGSAEKTGLTDHSVDAIVVAQAFHWFQAFEAKIEFQRILKPKKKVALLWNARADQSTEFMRSFEEFIFEHNVDYRLVDHRRLEKEGVLDRFFAPNSMEHHQFFFQQNLSWEELKGRVLSWSYMPNHNHPQFQTMQAALQSLFDRFAIHGRVEFHYRTDVYGSSL